MTENLGTLVALQSDVVSVNATDCREVMDALAVHPEGVDELRTLADSEGGQSQFVAISHLFSCGI